MSARPTLAAGLALLAALACAGSAAAEDAAAAGALFERGLADMQAGRFETGCPAIADSYRLDPRPGTLFTLAECEAKWGKIGSAVAHYRDYLARYDQMPTEQQSRQRERKEVAAAQVGTLASKVPQLTLTLKGAPPGTKVLRDGGELGPASLGVALPVDPGDHDIVVIDPRGARSEQRVRLEPGEARTLDLVVTGDAGATPGTASSWRRPVIFAAGGVAIVGVGISLLTGALALGKKSDISAGCNGYVCTPEGKQAADSAQSLAAVSTVTFIVGAAFGAASIVLFLTEPAKPTVARLTLTPLPGGAGVGVDAVW